MLTLNNVNIHQQNFSTRFGIFLTGKDKEAIQQIYYSFWNHEATGGELEWWCDNTALFWIADSIKSSCDEKFRMALAKMALAILRNQGDIKGRDPWPDACDLAMSWYETVERVTWLEFNVENDFGMGYSMGDSVAAEKTTGNFDDDVLAKTVTRSGIEKPELEEEEVC